MPANDLTIYSTYADEWWKEGAPHFRSLQNLTPFRLSMIREFIGDLKGKQVVDLGCGGGLISIPLLAGGAFVTGIDLSKESIDAARTASRGEGTFLVGDICAVELSSNSVDCVILADVLDHIPHFAQALREAGRILRVGGKLFVGTINRTLTSRFLTVTLGESLGFIPKGTHDYKLFVKPEELLATAALYGLQCEKIQGEWPVFLKTILERKITLKRSRSVRVAYTAVFRKVSHEK